MTNSTWIAAFSLLALTTSAVRAEDGCSKDTECKGERICIARSCVYPSAPPDSSSTIPASFEPQLPSSPKPTSTEVPRPELARPAALVFNSTANRHLGAFLRPDLGFGYVTASASQNGVDANINGTAGTFGIAVGGAVAENNILAFHFWDIVATNPTVSVGNSTVTNANATMTLIAFGPEYTAYS